ncbi:hypothetical protein ACQHIH_21955 (plasmid) [Xanthomonas sontii]|uniref:hypothetical protein n=1 Tax=Xanthomonas sontii TaxID=2650745 RepID=UPI003F86EB79
MRHQISTAGLTLCHVLPSERACALLERFFADSQPMSRAELLNRVLAEISWDDELILVRPLKVWVDRILTLLCSGGYMRRIHSVNGMSYQPTANWHRRRAVMDQFQHPSQHKRASVAPTERRRKFGVLPSDHVINLRDWAEVRAYRRQANA